MAVTKRRKSTSTRKRTTTAPAIDLSPWIAWGGLLLGAGLYLVHLPGGLLWWLGLTIAAFQVRKPDLTGKGRMGEPVPATPWEEKLQRRYRARAGSRRTILALSRDWIPWWPLPLGWLIAVGAAVIAAGLPLLTPLPEIIRWLDGAAVLLSIRTQASMWRAIASDPIDPIPQATLTDAVTGLVRGPVSPHGPRVGPVSWGVLFRMLWLLALTVGAGVGLAGWGVARGLFPVVATLPLVGFVPSTPPEPQTSTIPLWAAVGAIVGLGVVVSHDVRSVWRDRVAARTAWTQRFEVKAPKLVVPDLVGHDVVSSRVHVDTFQVPASQSRDDYVRLVDSLKDTLGSTTDLFLLPVLESDGAGGVSESRTQMRLVTWPDEARPDLSDTSVDDGVVALWAECALSSATDGQDVPSLVDLTRITTPESGQPAWTSDWTGGAPVGALRPAVGRVSAELGAPALINDQAGWLAFGALLDDATVFDESATGQESHAMHQIFQDVADADWWERVWTATMKGKEQQTPTYHAAQADVLDLPDGSEVRYAAFVTRQGLEPELYFGREQALSTAIEDAPFVSIQPFPNARESTPDRAVRHTQAISVAWAKPVTSSGSANRVPTTPQAVPPDVQKRSLRGSRSAQQVVLAAQVASAFRAAKLPAPLVTTVRSLSSPQARMHVWQVNLQLEESPFADVQKKLPAIRQALGCPWLRIEASREGAHLYAGASPTPSIVPESKLWRKTIDLDWADTWKVAHIVGSDGATPELVEAEPLPGNPDVVQAVFELPPTLSVERIRGGKAKLRAARGLAFLEIRTSKDSPTRLTVEFAESEPLSFPVPTNWDALAEPSEPHALAFGVGYDGAPKEFIPERDISLMILGMSGAGKSVTIQTVITSAIAQGYLVAVIDPQKGGVDFAFADGWLIAPRAEKHEDALATLRALYAEVEERKELHTRHGVGHWRELPDDVRRSPVLLVIDEFTSLVLPDALPPASKDLAAQRARAEVEAKNATRASIGGMVGRFLREARSVGVSTLLGTQKLDAKTMAAIPNAGDAKENASRMILGNPSTGAMASALKRPYEAPDVGDDVPKGRGRFEPGTGVAELFQSYYATQGELLEFLEDESALVPPPERILDVDAFRPDETVADAEEDESGILIYKRAPALDDAGEVEEVDFSDLGVNLDDLLDADEAGGIDSGDGSGVEAADESDEADEVDDGGETVPIEADDGTSGEDDAPVEAVVESAPSGPLEPAPEPTDVTLEDLEPADEPVFARPDRCAEPAAAVSNPFETTSDDARTEGGESGKGVDNPFSTVAAERSWSGSFSGDNPFS